MAYKDGCVKLHIMASVHSGFCDGSKFLFQGRKQSLPLGSTPYPLIGKLLELGEKP